MDFLACSRPWWEGFQFFATKQDIGCRFFLWQVYSYFQFTEKFFICIYLFLSFFFFFFFLPFPGPLLWLMEFPRLGVESELQPPAYARATATRGPSHLCSLHPSSRQRRILISLVEARDRTRNLMVLRFISAVLPWEPPPESLHHE